MTTQQSSPSPSTPKIGQASLGPTGRDLPGVDYEDDSVFGDGFHPNDNEFDDDPAPEELEAAQLEKQRANKIDKKPPRAAKKERPAKAADAGPAPPHATASSQQKLMCKVTRDLQPAGWKGAPVDRGTAGWVPSHDLRTILEEIEQAWGGGIYTLEYFRDGQTTGRTTQETVPGDPLPLRGEVEDDDGWAAPQRGPWPHPGGGFDPRVQFTPPGGPYPTHNGPQHGPPGAPPWGSWTPPGTTRVEDELKKKLEAAEAKLDQLASKAQEDKFTAQVTELKALVTAKQAPAGPNPMDSYLQIMQRQMDADRQRMEAQDRERQAKADREEKERKERLEAEERRYQRERQERLEREEREEKRRDEERKERQQRDDRMREEQREYMKLMAAQNKPENMLQMLAALKDLTPAPANPVEMLNQSFEMIERAKDLADESSGKGDDEEGSVGKKVVDGITGLAKGVGAYLENSRPAQQGAAPQQQVPGVAPQQLPGPGVQQAAPQQQAQDSEERVVARIGSLISLAVQSYQGKQNPVSTAAAIQGYAMRLAEEGHPGVMNDVAQLKIAGALPPDVLAAQLEPLKAKLVNQSHVGRVTEFQEILKTEAGAAWVAKTLGSL